MKNDLTLKLDTLLDDLARCKSAILEIEDIIKANGYTDSLVKSLVSFNVTKQKIEFNIKDVQNALEIMHKSVAYQTNQLNQIKNESN